MTTASRGCRRGARLGLLRDGPAGTLLRRTRAGLLLPCLGAIGATAVPVSVQAAPPIVAVFGVEDRTGQFDAAALQQLSDYLTTKIGEGGRFQVVPGGQIRQRLREQKKESFKACYDQSCQIEIGRELAAQKSLAGQIVRIGSRCAVLLTLFDLKRATTERSASQKAECAQDPMVAALERAVAALQGQHRPVNPRLQQAPPPATVAFRSKPFNAEVRVDGQYVGRTPTEARVRPGKHRVELSLAGYQSVRHDVSVDAGRTELYEVQLDPVEQPSAATARRPPASSAALPAATSVRTPRRRSRKKRLLAVIAGVAAGVSESAVTLGDVRAEFGGQALSFQVGAGFGDGVKVFRAAMHGYVPIVLTEKLWLMPMFGSAYSYYAVENAPSDNHNWTFLGGLRARYHVSQTLALIGDLPQVEVAVVNMAKDEGGDWDGTGAHPVQLTFQLGAAVLF